MFRQNHVLSLTECVWDFPNDALWDTHSHEKWFATVSTVRKLT